MAAGSGLISGLNSWLSAVATRLKTATTEVSISASTAPSAGYVLTATSSTAATWQAPAASTTKWAIISMSGDQASIDASGPDLVTGFDTVSQGSTGHGITVSAGVITLPANTTGYKWRLECKAEMLFSNAGGTGIITFSANPSGAPPVAAGYAARAICVTAGANFATAGTDVPVYIVAGAGSAGVICTNVSAGTITFESDYSRIYISEVAA